MKSRQMNDGYLITQCGEGVYKTFRPDGTLDHVSWPAGETLFYDSNGEVVVLYSSNSHPILY